MVKDTKRLIRVPVFVTFVILGLFFWWTVTALYLYENGHIIHNYQGPFINVEFTNW